MALKSCGCRTALVTAAVLLGKNVLEEMTLASRALANGRVLIPTAAHVYSIK